MRLAAHDQGFVIAAPDRVYARLADLATYETWWPGRRLTGASSSRERPGKGLLLDLAPPLHGTLEWYLEPFRSGTIVNAILDLDPVVGRKRSSRILVRARRAVRRGLVGLARELE